jgi:hypothetical protein
VPSGFVTTTFQVPCDPDGIVNQHFICVALSHQTLLAKISIFVFVLFVILAVKPCWKFVPIIVIGTSFPFVNVGLMLVMPSKSAGDSVFVGLGEPRIENMLAYLTNWPSGFVMTTSHAPAVAFDGGVNVHVIHVEDCTFTSVAVIFGLSSFIRVTVAPDWKLVPVRDVIEITVPAVPSSGSIFLKVGFPVGETVVVVVVDVELVCVVDTAAVVADTVDCRISMEARGLLVIFSVYTFSMTALFARSVLESSR